MKTTTPIPSIDPSPEDLEALKREAAAIDEQVKREEAPEAPPVKRGKMRKAKAAASTESAAAVPPTQAPSALEVQAEAFKGHVLVATNAATTMLQDTRGWEKPGVMWHESVAAILARIIAKHSGAWAGQYMDEVLAIGLVLQYAVPAIMAETERKRKDKEKDEKARAGIENNKSPEGDEALH